MHTNNSYHLTFQTVSIKWPIDIDNVNCTNNNNNKRQCGLWHVSSALLSSALFIKLSAQ